MLEELKKIRELLFKDSYVSSNTKDAMLKVDAIITRLENPGLVEEVSQQIGYDIQQYEQHIQDNAKAEDVADIAAQAALAVIKGTNYGKAACNT